VKTVLDFEGNGPVFFTRADPLDPRPPSRRNPREILEALGLYVFQRDALLEYPTLPQGDSKESNSSSNSAGSKTAGKSA